MNSHETGYFAAVQHRPATHQLSTTLQAFRSAASVVGVVVLVLATLAVGVYAIVFVDLMPYTR